MADWDPTLEDVAALVRARTKTPTAGEAGTFNDDTRPTGDQVTSLIARAVEKVTGRATPCDSDNGEIESQAKGLAAMYAAMLIELSYFPEQVASDKSPYARLKELFDEGIDTYVEIVEENCPGDEGEVDAAGAQKPHYDFGNEGLIGRGTVL